MAQVQPEEREEPPMTCTVTFSLAVTDVSVLYDSYVVPGSREATKVVRKSLGLAVRYLRSC